MTTQRHPVRTALGLALALAVTAVLTYTAAAIAVSWLAPPTVPRQHPIDWGMP